MEILIKVRECVVNGVDAIKVYSNVYPDGIYVTWDELRDGSLDLETAKQRVVDISEQMIVEGLC